MHKTRISMKHETGFNFETIIAGKHCSITQMLRRLNNNLDNNPDTSNTPNAPNKL
jgi:hypothetical protein